MKAKHIPLNEESSLLRELEPILAGSGNEVIDFFSTYLQQLAQLSQNLIQPDRDQINNLFSIKLAKQMNKNEVSEASLNTIETEHYLPQTLIAFMLLNLKYLRSMLNHYISQDIPDNARNMKMTITVNKLLDQDLLTLSRIYGQNLTLREEISRRSKTDQSSI